MVNDDDLLERGVKKKRHSFLISSMIRLVKEKPLGTVGGIITLFLLLAGIFADFLAPYGINETHTADTLMGPSAQYWFGTDNLGRDILSRIIFGARISVIVGLSVAAIATIISAIIGIVSGYAGGKLDLICGTGGRRTGRAMIRRTGRMWSGRGGTARVRLRLRGGTGAGRYGFCRRRI